MHSSYLNYDNEALDAHNIARYHDVSEASKRLGCVHERNDLMSISYLEEIHTLNKLKKALCSNNTNY